MATQERGEIAHAAHIQRMQQTRFSLLLLGSLTQCRADVLQGRPFIVYQKRLESYHLPLLIAAMVCAYSI